GNLLRDLAALNEVEVLPWDEWGPMEASYRGETDDAFDRLMDDVAAVCAGDGPTALADAYASFAVPAEIIR
ncbi:MAG TPA: hypothetical protein VHK88_10510, partial [Aquihabitans sp.]|nr:hypothetical protein [Aquihabitans sp.]